jgi:hypothetical protein
MKTALLDKVFHCLLEHQLPKFASYCNQHGSTGVFLYLWLPLGNE